MKVAISEITALILCSAWIAGFVIASGFWSTLACIIPFWSYYLVIEKVMINFGLI